MNADGLAVPANAEDRIYRTVASVLGVPAAELSDDSSPETLPAWDSLNHLNLVMALEGEFGISLTPEDAMEMRTVGSIRAVLGNNGVEVGPKPVFIDCQESQLAEVRAFFARTYRPDYRLATDDALLRWQYGPTPASPDKPCHLKLAWLDGVLAGCLGYMPLEVSLNGRVVNGTWVANWMVEEHQRRLGLGPFLMCEVTRQFEVGLDLGANVDAHSLLSRMGWNDMGDLPRYVCVLDCTGAAALTENGQLEWPAVTPPQGIRTGGPTTVRSVDRFGDGATRFWDSTWGAKGSLAGGTRRSAEFLNWRYTIHPVFQYRLFEARQNGQVSGIAVYHVEQVRNQPLRVGRLVELILDVNHSSDVDAALLGAVLDDARSQGVVMMDFFCASGRLSEVMTRHGFLPGEREPASRIPMLFQPVDRRRSGIRFMAHLGSVPEAAAVRDWYVTKSDGDQDRPN
ncbi:MAG TPA: acyl carrier protein [Verrucomicrobiae bacterium]|nr:acyl carrier protein [Verrucomicrobiae bacterium]